MSHLRFESNVNYDLGKTHFSIHLYPSLFESNVNYDFKGQLKSKNCELQQPQNPICQRQMIYAAWRAANLPLAKREWKSVVRAWGSLAGLPTGGDGTSVGPLPVQARVPSPLLHGTRMLLFIVSVAGEHELDHSCKGGSFLLFTPVEVCPQKGAALVAFRPWSGLTRRDCSATLCPLLRIQQSDV